VALNPITKETSNVPTGNVDDPFYVAGDVAGDVDSLYANAGIVNLRADRSQEAATPWASPVGGFLRKLTHFRAPGMGDPMWSGACVYDLAGASPSFSEYDQADFYAGDDDLTYSITAGVVKSHDRLDVQEPTSTRRSRVAAHYDSAPASSFFQGVANFRWSGLLTGYQAHAYVSPRPLHMNFNPGQMGSKELHKATQYQPAPPMGSLVGYFGSDAKAL
jgi:hypothetical protein